MQKVSADIFLQRLFPAAPPAPLCFPAELIPAVPLLDVRSPGEFAHAHVPGAINLPLFTDEERSEVGTLYKSAGREKAMCLGFSLVGSRLGAMAEQLVEIAGRDRSLALYCSRGGMRSGSVAWLCTNLGLHGILLAGGYKAYRQHVLLSFEKKCRLLVLGGHTGSGKTEVLHLLAARGEQVIDLEGLAAHRGSAFGSLANIPQPSTAHFENMLAAVLDGCNPEQPVWIEDECENLGKVNIPFTFFRQMNESRVLVLDMPRKARLTRVLAEYGAIEAERMQMYLDRIRKRLGGLAHKNALGHLAEGDLASIASILLDYYDRAYDKQLAKRPPATHIQAGSAEEAAERLLAWKKSSLFS